jgi:hypothetical protein
MPRTIQAPVFMVEEAPVGWVGLHLHGPLWPQLQHFPELILLLVGANGLSLRSSTVCDFMWSWDFLRRISTQISCVLEGVPFLVGKALISYSSEHDRHMSHVQ